MHLNFQIGPVFPLFLFKKWHRATLDCQRAAKPHSRVHYLSSICNFSSAFWIWAGFQTMIYWTVKSCQPQKELCGNKNSFQGLKPPVSSCHSQWQHTQSWHTSKAFYKLLLILTCKCPRHHLPVCTSPLWCQFHAINWVVAVIIHDFGKSKICDFYLSTCSTID